MKVNIGPFISWIGPYQIAQKLCFWAKSEKDEFGFKKTPDWVHDFGTFLAGGEKQDSVLSKVCSYIHEKRKRKIKVKLQPYDTWNMDSTLAIVILPMLKQFRDNAHSSPSTDLEDVPEYLHPKVKPSEENNYEDETVHERWKWVLDQIIWSFEQLHPDSDWEDQFHKGVADIYFEKCENSDLSVMMRGPKDTYSFDHEGYKKHSERIDNGLRLFGKYYRGLWS